MRRYEHRELTASGDSTLAGTRYLWLRTPAKMTRKVKAQLVALRAEALLTAKAWYYNVMTTRSQGRNPHEFLVESARAARAKTSPPSLLPANPARELATHAAA